MYKTVERTFYGGLDSVIRRAGGQPSSASLAVRTIRSAQLRVHWRMDYAVSRVHPPPCR
jgi:hypothetical protein